MRYRGEKLGISRKITVSEWLGLGRENGRRYINEWGKNKLEWIKRNSDRTLYVH